jgi:hypothetical protein
MSIQRKQLSPNLQLYNLSYSTRMLYNMQVATAIGNTINSPTLWPFTKHPDTPAIFLPLPPLYVVRVYNDGYNKC